MQSLELMEQLLSGDTTELVFYEPVRFRRRTRSNHCTFEEFLAALVACETLEGVDLLPTFIESITDDQWFRLVQALGRVPCLRRIAFGCGSSVPLLALVAAVSNPTLRHLSFGHNVVFEGNQEAVLAAGVGLGRSTIEQFGWPGSGDELSSIVVDPFMMGFSGSDHIQVVELGRVSLRADVLEELVRCDILKSLDMQATAPELLVLGQEMALGNSSLEYLELSVHLPTEQSLNKGINVLAIGIAASDSLEFLDLHVCNGLTDEAGLDLAEAIEANTSLIGFNFTYSLCGSFDDFRPLGHVTYGAMAKMLRQRTDLELAIPGRAVVFDPRTGTVDGPCRETQTQYAKMRIQMGLNAVGFGDLLGQTDRRPWVDSFDAVNNRAGAGIDNDIHLDCLYELLLTNPMICNSD